MCSFTAIGAILTSDLIHPHKWRDVHPIKDCYSTANTCWAECLNNATINLYVPTHQTHSTALFTDSDHILSSPARPDKQRSHQWSLHYRWAEGAGATLIFRAVVFTAIHLSSLLLLKNETTKKNLKHIQSCPKITASNKYAQTISNLSSIYSPTTKILNSSRLPDTPCTLTTPAAASNLKNLPGKANDSMATIPSYFSGSPAFLRILYFS